MFIEITRKYGGTKAIINVHRIDMVEPMPPKDGYGNEQTGCIIHFEYSGRNDGHVTNVTETYMQVLTAIEAVTGKEVGTIGR